MSVTEMGTVAALAVQVDPTSIIALIDRSVTIDRLTGHLGRDRVRDEALLMRLMMHRVGLCATGLAISHERHPGPQRDARHRELARSVPCHGANGLVHVPINAISILCRNGEEPE